MGFWKKLGEELLKPCDIAIRIDGNNTKIVAKPHRELEIENMMLKEQIKQLKLDRKLVEVK